MFKVYKKEIEVAGKKISLETGKVARQADGAIIATCGETVVLATVVGAKKVNPDMDYFPLSVNYHGNLQIMESNPCLDLLFLLPLQLLKQPFLHMLRLLLHLPVLLLYLFLNLSSFLLLQFPSYIL